MQVGPAAPRSQPGGAELRDNIYSWPLMSRCAVEEQIVSGATSPLASPHAGDPAGLVALEYLLFYEGADTACASSSPIVAQGTWAALSAEERAARKRAYAAAVAGEVRQRAQPAGGRVGSGKGNFLETLVTAGPGNAVYPTGQAGAELRERRALLREQRGEGPEARAAAGLRECGGHLPGAAGVAVRRTQQANIAQTWWASGASSRAAGRTSRARASMICSARWAPRP